MPKTARRLIGEPWVCKKPWPENCKVQCGGHGLVLPSGSLKKVLGPKGDPIKSMDEAVAHKDTYITAFFEAFPRDPDTFIRGEGKTIEEAEAQAWKHLERIRACPGHEFEKRGYTNGAGFCKHCNLFKSGAFEPTQ